MGALAVKIHRLQFQLHADAQDTDLQVAVLDPLFDFIAENGVAGLFLVDQDQVGGKGIIPLFHDGFILGPEIIEMTQLLLGHPGQGFPPQGIGGILGSVFIKIMAEDFGLHGGLKPFRISSWDVVIGGHSSNPETTYRFHTPYSTGSILRLDGLLVDAKVRLGMVILLFPSDFV